MAALGFGVSFILSLGLVWLVRWLSLRSGRLARPREDRWHRQPTPNLGGVGIFLAVFISVLVSALLRGQGSSIHWGLLACAAFVWVLGLYDDLRELTPPVKLLGQLVAASLVIFLGYQTSFFTPKIANSILAQLPNLVLTFFWLVGITNAINLIDNIDGLAGGISLITAAFLSYFFWRSGETGLMTFSLAIAGSLLGFLVFNFPPASIFMGDSGSQFLGFTLAVLAIARQPQASNVFAVLGVPTLLFMLPILDTSLVMITRLLRGQSPAQGGRDHTSHRLIAFGLTERQTLLVLYGVAVLSGVAGIAIETLDYWLSLVFVPILVMTLALFAAYLGRIKVVVGSAGTQPTTFARLVVDLAYKRRSLEILLDFFLIGIAYYLSFWTGSGLSMNDASLELFLQSLPLAFLGSYLSFFLFGVYRGVWRYVGVDNLIGYAKATMGAVATVSIAVLLIYPQDNYSPVVFLLFAVFLFLGLASSRSSFKILDMVYGLRARSKEQRVLIVGAGDAGEMAVRWILMNPQFGYRPIGFLDDDPLNSGRQIHGVGILGDTSQLEVLIQQKQVDGILVTPDEHISESSIDRVISICHAQGRWVRSMRLEFELVE